MSCKRNLDKTHGFVSKCRYAYSRPVARFQSLRGRENTFLGRKDFCFYYMLKKNFLGTTQFRETQKAFGATAQNGL